MPRRNMGAHLRGKVVDLGIIQQIVEDAHDVNDLARVVAHGSIRQLTRHSARRLDMLRSRLLPIAKEAVLLWLLLEQSCRGFKRNPHPPSERYTDEAPEYRGLPIQSALTDAERPG